MQVVAAFADISALPKLNVLNRIPGETRTADVCSNVGFTWNSV